MCLSLLYRSRWEVPKLLNGAEAGQDLLMALTYDMNLSLCSRAGCRVRHANGQAQRGSSVNVTHLHRPLSQALLSRLCACAVPLMARSGA